MLPWDEEFVMVYAFHLLALLVIGVKLIYSNRKKTFAIHAIIFAIYLIFNISLFMDDSNFQGGGSLVVLFYSGISPLVHLIILLIQETIAFVLKQSKRN